MSDGLPADFKADELDWTETLGYLEAIRGVGLPVLIWTDDARAAGRSMLKTRGHLREGGPTEKYDGVWYWIDWPLGNENGVLTLPQDQFESGSLRTIDGADYFDLRFSFGSWSILIGDDNLVSWPWVDPWVMTRKSRPKPLENLPIAEEIRAEFQARKDSPVTQETFKAAISRRDRLVADGIENAGEMSGFEIIAASLRALWHLRDEGSVTRLDKPGDDFEELLTARLAEDLKPPTGETSDDRDSRPPSG